MNEGRRTQLLRSEMMRCIDDGWDVVERNPFDMILEHPVDPPWWWFALLIVEPFTWFVVAPRPGDVRRYLHVTIDEEGTLTRFTIGDVPPTWRRRRRWERPDGVFPLRGER